MAFKIEKIVGTGAAQVAVTNTVSLEAVVNALVAYNTTGSEAGFSLLLDGQEVVKELIAANDSFRFPDKLNLPMDTVLSVNADTGVNVTVSYFQQAIDVAAAMSVVQQAVIDSDANATRAENAIPAGAIDDSISAADKVYSSAKVETELAEKASSSHGHTKSDVGLTNVDNTSDLDKPISTAAQAALDLKATGEVVDAKADSAPEVFNNGSVSGSLSIDLANGYKQKAIIAGATTISITGWPTSGKQGESELEVVNGGAFVVTLPATNWIIAAGAVSTAFADTKVLLNAAGSNTIVWWSDDAGAALSGVAG